MLRLVSAFVNVDQKHLYKQMVETMKTVFIWLFKLSSVAKPVIHCHRDMVFLPAEPAKKARKEDLAFEWRMGCAEANFCSIPCLKEMSMYFLKSGINECCVYRHCINISTCDNLESGQLYFEWMNCSSSTDLWTTSMKLH